MNPELPPSIVFGAGALCMLTCVLIIIVAVGIAFFHWCWGNVSSFRTLGADRDRGVVKLRAELDEKAPAVSASTATPKLLSTNGRPPSDYDVGPG